MRRLVVALTGALVLVSATAVGQTVLSMATLAPPGSTWMRVFDAANRELRRRTSGQLSLRWYAGGVQGDEGEVVRRIRGGRLDGAALTAIGLGHVHRPILAFQLPGMFSTPAELVRARDALTNEINAGFEREGFVLGGFGGGGSTRLFSRRPIRTPSDLRTVRPWIWRDDVILPALYAEAQATGVPLQLPEVLGALQTRRIDTFIASPLAALALQWSQSAQYMSDRSNSVTLGGLVFARARVNALPADQQQALRTVLAQYLTLLVRNVDRDDEAAAATLQQRGIQVVTLTPAEQVQWAALFTRTRARLVGTIADAAWINRVAAAAHGH